MRLHSSRIPYVGLLLAGLWLAGCQVTPKIPTLTPYKMDIQQGNFVTQEMISKLKPGMTPSQVRFLLGTPLVVDAFHKDRWDYVYRFSKAGKLQEARRIVIVFKDDRLDRIEGDVVPAAGGGATAAGVRIEPAVRESQPETRSGTGSDSGAGAQAGSHAPKSSGTGGQPEVEAAPAGKKPAGEKEEERGFFGRMLENLGF